MDRVYCADAIMFLGIVVGKSLAGKSLLANAKSLNGSTCKLQKRGRRILDAKDIHPDLNLGYAYVISLVQCVLHSNADLWSVIECVIQNRWKSS